MQNNILSAFPTLSSERLTLREPTESDAPELLILRSDARVNKYLGRKPTATAEEALGFIRKVNENFKNNTGVYWAITQTGEQKLIGTICIFNLSGELKSCEIGFELMPCYHGKGIMNEALKKVIEFSFHTLGVETIEACTHKDNKGSLKLLQKFDFEQRSIVEEINSDLIILRLSN